MLVPFLAVCFVILCGYFTCDRPYEMTLVSLLGLATLFLCVIAATLCGR